VWFHPVLESERAKVNQNGASLQAIITYLFNYRRIKFIIDWMNCRSVLHKKTHHGPVHPPVHVVARRGHWPVAQQPTTAVRPGRCPRPLGSTIGIGSFFLAKIFFSRISKDGLADGKLKPNRRITAKEPRESICLPSNWASSWTVCPTGPDDPTDER
jgi:hypothetical protein